MRGRSIAACAVALAAAVTAILTLRAAPSPPPDLDAAAALDAGDGTGSRAGLAPSSAGLGSGRGPAPAATGDRPPLPAGTGFLDVLVVDLDDTPVAGVPVEATTLADDEDAISRLFGDEPPRDPEPLAVAATGADGTVRFSGIDAERGYVLTARPPPPRVGTCRAASPHALGGGRARLRVADGAPLRVRVVDPAGAGIESAIVRPSGEDSQSEDTWEIAPVRTGADGRAAWAAVPRGYVRLEAVAPRRAALDGVRVGARVPTDGLPTDEEFVIRLGEVPGVRVEGTVRDRSGRPVAGARVVVGMTPAHPGGTAGTLARGLALSGPDGAYRTAAMPAGKFTEMTVLADGHARWTLEDEARPLAAGESLRVDVRLSRGARIEGRVRGPSGEPVTGVSVRAWGSSAQAAESDETGRFVVDGLTKRTYAILADARRWSLVIPPGRSNVEVTIADEAEVCAVDLAMRRRSGVEGRVVDARGEGVPGAFVRMVPDPKAPRWKYFAYRWDGEDDGGEMAQAVTDSEGRFSLWDATPRDRLVAWAGERRSEVLDPATAPPPWVLRLLPCAGIRGKLVDSRSRPVAGRTVEVAPEGARATTDATGAFALLRLGAGRHRVYVPSGGGIRQWRGLEPVTVLEPEVRELEWGLVVDGVVLRVEESEIAPPADPAAETLGSAQGVVVDEEGRPVASANVQAASEQGLREWTQTDSEGAFRLVELAPPPVTYLIQVDGRPTSAAVHGGARDVRVVDRRPPPRVLRGRVIDPDGRPVARADVKTSGHRWSDDTSARDGTFAMAIPPRATGAGSGDDRDDGLVSVGVSGAFDQDGREIDARPILVEGIDPDAGPVDLTLERGFSIAGRVVAEDGAGAPGVALVAGTGNEWRGACGGAPASLPSSWARSARSGEDGAFRLTGLPAGPVKVVATPEGPGWEGPVEAVIEAGESSASIRLARAGTVEGRVVDARGAPASGVRVRWSRGGDDAPDGPGRALTREDGAFSLGAVPLAGTVEVVALTDGADESLAGRLDGVRAGARDLVVRLPEEATVEGEVVAADGSPVRRGQVYLVPAGAPSAVLTVGGGLDGTDNRFVVGPVPPGSYYVLHSPSPVWRFASASPPSIPQGTPLVTAPARGIRFVVGGLCTLRGRVLGTDVEGFCVEWIPGRGEKGGRVAATARTLPDGRFAIPGVAAEQDGTLFVSRKGDPRCALVENVRPLSGATEIRLAVGLTIEGRVEGWTPAHGPLVVYATDRGVSVSGPVAADGRFVVRGLPGGAYGLTAGTLIGAAESEAVPAGSTGVVLAFALRD